ncbi:MAG TPA: ThuA domain-containing protein, partial [Chthoniobacteraceae bacterium]|nr:ThuA domain-containing protein [Chthoniobacteraceae bacterium]
MKRLLILLTLLVALLSQASAVPLRVFIRGGKKSHGPNAHEHERFLNDWKKLLTARGAAVDGALDWPTAAQLARTDVLVMYAQDGGNATPEQQAAIVEFTKRGGGLVVVHTATVSNDPPWWKSVIGGAWVPGKTKWKEGPMDLYYTENQLATEQHPITRGASNFHLDDEIYYDMDISPDVRVLATSYTPNVPSGRKVAAGGKANIYDIQPQMWVYEKDNYRAFVSIPGHLYGTFEKPNFRAILLRGIAWAGKRQNIEEFTNDEEVRSLTYPEGGPQRPEQTLSNLEVHPDFKMTLVASEPNINKPMNFDWAPDGSLWVAETPEYPNGRRGMRPDYRGKEWKDHGGIVPQPGEQARPGRDRISKLVDTNSDGIMDKKEIFYEGLDLVTGLVFHQDGVIVTQAPDILWLRDT